MDIKEKQDSVSQQEYDLKSLIPKLINQSSVGANYKPPKIIKRKGFLFLIVPLVILLIVGILSLIPRSISNNTYNADMGAMNDQGTIDDSMVGDQITDDVDNALPKIYETNQGAIDGFVLFYMSYINSLNSQDFSNMEYCTDYVVDYLETRLSINSNYLYDLNAIYLDYESVVENYDAESTTVQMDFVCETVGTNRTTGAKTDVRAVWTVTMKYHEGNDVWYVDAATRQPNSYETSNNLTSVAI